MVTNLRHRQILQLLEENGAVSVKALTAALFVSEATIRRDLHELEKAGALQRTFGGALPVLSSPRQVPLFIREGLNTEEKYALCRQAAAMLKDGDTLFIDGSSTAQHLVKFLTPLKDLTVVTYSIRTAELACRHHIKTYCTGGLLMENSLVCTGQETVAFADKINPDFCFFSCKGLSEDGIFSDTSEEETVIRRAFLKRSRTRVALMTKNKLGKRYFHTLCTMEDVDHLLTDASADHT